MRILLTNDDGINAPGLAVLEEIARAITDDVWIVAPEVDNSGASHSLTLSDPLRLRKLEPQRYAVKGTPTDCVIMALRHILRGERPDLVLSGVNRGHNIAEDVTYSGTVAGAMEGTLLGIKSIALSQGYGVTTDRTSVNWDVSRSLGPKIVNILIGKDFPKETLVNVNFPDTNPDQVEGVRITRQGKRTADSLKIDERRDGRGNPYYWLGFQRRRFEPEPNTDLWALAHNYVSVTPLHLNLTDDRFRADLDDGALF